MDAVGVALLFYGIPFALVWVMGHAVIGGVQWVRRRSTDLDWVLAAELVHHSQARRTNSCMRLRASRPIVVGNPSNAWTPPG